MTRAFVAVVPPEPVLDGVERATGRRRRDTRPADDTPAQWHLTLQFLGNRADIDAVAGRTRPCRCRPARFGSAAAGAFPKVRRAQVLWVGAAEGDEYLATLAGEVAARLAPLGFDPKDRRYHAHLTLGRTRTATDLHRGRRTARSVRARTGVDRARGRRLRESLAAIRRGVRPRAVVTLPT